MVIRKPALTPGKSLIMRYPGDGQFFRNKPRANLQGIRNSRDTYRRIYDDTVESMEASLTTDIECMTYCKVSA